MIENIVSLLEHIDTLIGINLVYIIHGCIGGIFNAIFSQDTFKQALRKTAMGAIFSNYITHIAIIYYPSLGRFAYAFLIGALTSVIIQLAMLYWDNIRKNPTSFINRLLKLKPTGNEQEHNGYTPNT